MVHNLPTYELLVKIVAGRAGFDSPCPNFGRLGFLCMLCPSTRNLPPRERCERLNGVPSAYEVVRLNPCRSPLRASCGCVLSIFWSVWPSELWRNTGKRAWCTGHCLYSQRRIYVVGGSPAVESPSPNVASTFPFLFNF
jgi:hypothetical protein